MNTQSEIRLNRLMSATLDHLLGERGKRFGLYDSGDIGDRYTLVDFRKTCRMDGVYWYDYFSFDAHPTHPQGIGIHGEFNERDLRAFRKRNTRKRIALSDLPDTAQPSALTFIRDCDLAHATIAALATFETAADTICAGIASDAINAHALAAQIDTVRSKLDAALRNARVKRD